jgi:putative flippase GtrA
MTGESPRTSAARGHQSTITRQFSSFVIVGVITTAVHYGVLIALVEAFNARPVLATGAGFLAAVLVSYPLNRSYTFHDPRFGPGLLKYVAAVSLGLLINVGCMAALTKLGAHYLVAQVVASGLALAWNFAAARFVLLRKA